MLAPGSYPPEVTMRLATGLFAFSVAFSVAFSSSILVACGGGGGGGDDGTGDDAPGPDADPGLQFRIVTEEVEIAPGEEVTYCYHTTIDIDQAVGVKKWASSMTPGSHHLIVYFTDQARYPDGTLNEDCGGTGVPYWTYSAGTPEYENAMPDGVGMRVDAQQAVYVQLHYLNTSPSTPILAHAEITGDYYPPGEDYIPAAAFITFHTGISIPPNGTASVTGTCARSSFPELQTGNFFTLSTHAHKRAVHTQVDDGSSMVFESTDWEHPGEKSEWRTSPYTFSGDLVYSCDYQNDLNQTVTTGDSAATDEMCMAVGYFYPADNGPQFCLSF